MSDTNAAGAAAITLPAQHLAYRPARLAVVARAPCPIPKKPESGRVQIPLAAVADWPPEMPEPVMAAAARTTTLHPQIENQQPVSKGSGHAADG